MQRSMILLIALMTAALARADTASTLRNFVGFTVVAVKTIDGYRNKDGKSNSSFEGCDFERIIRFDDGTGVRCIGYGYQYAYRPEAAILIDRYNNWKMIVGNDVYDVSPQLR